jgi:hypothetical protein
LNQALYLPEQDHVEDLASFRDFFNEINEEIGDIATSSERATAYISNIVSIRTKILKIYSHFVGKLGNWPNIITFRDYYGNNQQIDFISLHNDYCFCRQAISCYMICLIYEYVISGNVESKSFEKISKKVKEFIQRFNNCDEKIKRALNQRDQSNKNWNWNYSQDKQDDSNEISWFLNQCQDDPDFEIKKIKSMFDKGKSLLGNIHLIQDK